jgi:hypothetical protein
MNRIKDKLSAIKAILFCNEFAVFTAKRLDNAQGCECWYSEGLEDKEKSDIFRKAISDFILNE